MSEARSMDHNAIALCVAGVGGVVFDFDNALIAAVFINAGLLACTATILRALATAIRKGKT